MAVATDITINDGQGTPVAHTFEVAELRPTVASFEDKSPGVYNGYNRLSLGLLRPNGNARSATRNIKLRVRIICPIMEVLSNSTITGIEPAPTVAYTSAVDVVITLPERCALLDRQNLLAYIQNLFGHAVMVDLFEDYSLPH